MYFMTKANPGMGAAVPTGMFEFRRQRLDHGRSVAWIGASTLGGLSIPRPVVSGFAIAPYWHHRQNADQAKANC